MRKIETESLEFQTGYGNKTNSIKNIKQILLEQGYTDTQIRWMRLNDMVLTVPITYASKLKKGSSLIILNEPPRAKVETGKSNRFASIGSEEE